MRKKYITSGACAAGMLYIAPRPPPQRMANYCSRCVKSDLGCHKWLWNCIYLTYDLDIWSSNQWLCLRHLLIKNWLVRLLIKRPRGRSKPIALWIISVLNNGSRYFSDWSFLGTWCQSYLPWDKCVCRLWIYRANWVINKSLLNEFSCKSKDRYHL